MKYDKVSLLKNILLIGFIGALVLLTVFYLILVDFYNNQGSDSLLVFFRMLTIHLPLVILASLLIGFASVLLGVRSIERHNNMNLFKSTGKLKIVLMSIIFSIAAMVSSGLFLWLIYSIFYPLINFYDQGIQVLFSKMLNFVVGTFPVFLIMSLILSLPSMLGGVVYVLARMIIQLVKH